MNFQGSRTFFQNSFKNMNKSCFNNKFSFNMFKTKLNSFKFHTLAGNSIYMMNVNILNSSKNMKTNLLLSTNSSGSIINQGGLVSVDEASMNLCENGILY